MKYKVLDSRVCSRAGFPLVSQRPHGIAPEKFSEPLGRTSIAQQLYQRDFLLLPKWDQYRNAFAVFKNTRIIESSLQKSTQYRGQLQHITLDDYKLHELRRITGPFDLAGRWNLFRSFYIPKKKEKVMFFTKHQGACDDKINGKFITTAAVCRQAANSLGFKFNSAKLKWNQKHVLLDLSSSSSKPPGCYLRTTGSDPNIRISLYFNTGSNVGTCDGTNGLCFCKIDSNSTLSKEKSLKDLQFEQIDTLFEAKIWFFGEWPKRGGSHDVKLFIGKKLIWALSGELVCSGHEYWKGKFTKNNFQWSKQPFSMPISKFLSQKTCYVDISSRNIQTSGSIVKVRLYVDGNVSPNNEYLIGISDDSLIVMMGSDMASRYLKEDRTTLVPNKGISRKIISTKLMDNKYKSALHTVFSAGVRLCKTTEKNECGPWSYVNSGSLNMIEVATIEKIGNEKFRFDIQNVTSPVGLPLQSVIVEMMSCPKTGCVFSTTRINITKASHFDYEVASGIRTSDPIKFGLKLCNQLEHSHGCGRTYFLWNYPKSWYFDAMDSAVTARLKTGRNLVRGNMTVQSTWSHSSNTVVRANERTTTWSHSFETKTTDTINAWVGCFNTSVPGAISISNYSYTNPYLKETTEGCAFVCQSKNYFYTVKGAGDDGCKCTQLYPQDIYENQLPDVECGNVCENEEIFVPKRYCGKNSAVGVWRTQLLALQTRSFQLLVGKIPEIPDKHSEKVDASSSKSLLVPTFPCVNSGYVVFSKEQLNLRVGEDWLVEYHQHFACLAYSQRVWQIDVGVKKVYFLPRESDVIVAIVNSDKDPPSMTKGQYALINIPTIRLGYLNGDIYIVPHLDCRLPNSYLLVRCFSVSGYGFTPQDKTTIFGGKRVDSGNPSQTIVSTIQPYHSSLSDPIDELVDIIGPIPFTVVTKVCSIRGDTKDFLPICSSKQNAIAEAIQDAPLTPGRPVLKNIKRTLEDQTVHFVEASWRPPLFWGLGAMNENATRGIEYQLVKIGNNSLCGVDEKDPSLDLCVYKKIYIENDKNQIIERKNCRLGATDDQLLLPSCACSTSMCNGAVLAMDIVPTARIILADLYEKSYYRIRIRSTVHQTNNEQLGFKLQDIRTRNSFQNSSWTKWSDPIFSQVGSLPSRPPQPVVIEAGYTSVMFRIYRAAWNSNPITHYNFLMAKDTACGDLSNLVWDEVDPVIVPVNSTFTPYIDFLRGDPNKGGIGPALENGLYHFKVRAQNGHGVGNYSDYKIARNPVQLGTLNFPAQIDTSQPPALINQTTCEDIKRKQPLCSSIEMARLVFYEIVNMKYLLVPNTYHWTNVSFGREGTKIFGNTSNPEDTIIDCGGNRCFQICREPLYIKGTPIRCFPPVVLEYLTFKNGYIKNGNGGVMNNFPSVLVLQRRAVVLKHLIFELNIAENGNGGALAFENRLERASVTITDVIFRSNHARGGAGGAYFFVNQFFVHFFKLP